MKLKISYEIELVLDPSIYWEGATKEEMIEHELKNANENPDVYLSIAHENGTYKAEIVES